jgi:hypothetical protein
MEPYPLVLEFSNDSVLRSIIFDFGRSGNQEDGVALDADMGDNNASGRNEVT